MRKTQFIPESLGHDGSKLEERVVLSQLRVRPAAVRRNLSNGNGNGFSFVVAVPPQTQASLNFTSHTYWQIVKGGPTDLEDIVDDFQDARENASEGDILSGEFSDALRGLDSLAGRVPYGRQALLPVWIDTLQNSVGIDEDTIEARLRNDLRTYINSGVGTDWNILKSTHKHSTDGDLLYNGKVKRG